MALKPKRSARPLAPHYRGLIAHFRGSRQKGWVPFASKDFTPESRRVAIRALPIVMKQNIGVHRSIRESAESAIKIIPITATTIAESMKGKIPEKDYATFKKMMQWLSANPSESAKGGKWVPKRIVAMAIAMGKKTRQEIFKEFILNWRAKIKVDDNAGKYYLADYGSVEDFQKALEWQVKHDMSMSLSAVHGFLNETIVPGVYT